MTFRLVTSPLFLNSPKFSVSLVTVLMNLFQIHRQGFLRL